MLFSWALLKSVALSYGERGIVKDISLILITISFSSSKAPI